MSDKYSQPRTASVFQLRTTEVHLLPVLLVDDLDGTSRLVPEVVTFMQALVSQGESLSKMRGIANTLALLHDYMVIAKGAEPVQPERLPELIASFLRRRRFHRFQHRALFKAVALRAEELGMRMLEVFAGGTSRWSYDGSGKVVRDPKNAQLATFATGKQYNADLNAANNIAARGLAVLLKIKNPRPAKAPVGGVRMPLVLADVWAYARRLGASLTALGGVSDAPTKAAVAA